MFVSLEDGGWVEGLNLRPTGKVETVRREYEPGRFTTDVYLDGKRHAIAVGDELLPEILRRINRASGVTRHRPSNQPVPVVT